ncbi:MAG: excisionase family DNA-binding protein [Gemmataceae bacterium]
MGKRLSPDDWISQSEAARLRNVTRQAIAKLVRKGRLRTLVLGGHRLVRKSDVLSYQPGNPGRPKSDAEK